MSENRVPKNALPKRSEVVKVLKKFAMDDWELKRAVDELMMYPSVTFTGKYGGSCKVELVRQTERIILEIVDETTRGVKVVELHSWKKERK